MTSKNTSSKKKSVSSTELNAKSKKDSKGKNEDSSKIEESKNKSDKQDNVEADKKDLGENKQEKVELPSKSWKILLKIDADVSQEIELVDLKDANGSYMHIRRKFFDDLLEIVGNNKNYTVGKAIETVNGIDDKDWTKNSWLLVMAKEVKNNSIYWLLFKRKQDLSGMLVAIGPKEFIESIIKLLPKDIDSRFEYLKKIMIWLTVGPNKWKNVGIFIPNWL
ncbi:MAG: hypothetical protein ACTSRA_19105 [Promethearchaeota archaeon]